MTNELERLFEEWEEKNLDKGFISDGVVNENGKTQNCVSF